ncbi:adenomatous polyposis coli protein-like protein [Leptotrombidium deliense]|uniref:Adenomatous polyposis coli protein-like protein n=1 Tax=Leptotrombidium deliense TaxID=299467 RepID=A0A443SNX1_9ACAR|nr:adenomatous polyposis coli protein-like protein [Leptotrombidium deliense]
MLSQWKPGNRPLSGSLFEAKVDPVFSVISLLNRDNKQEMTEKLHEMSVNATICRDMRQYGCLPLLIQLIHPLDGFETCDSSIEKFQEGEEVRNKACEALHNIIKATDDKRELRVLRLLEEIRTFSQILRRLGWMDDENIFKASQSHPGPAISSLMKFSFDEKHRKAICDLGGLQAIAELLYTDCDYHGNTINGQCITIRRYASMALTNLTFGDEKNKSLLCSMKLFMRALVQQLCSPSEELRQVTASVIRNLSWRADSMSKQTLREVGVVVTLMRAALEATKESTLKSILSALWNLSAHSVANKADICTVDGALQFLVTCLTNKSLSNTLAIVENGGGILRNISSHIAVNEEYRVILRENNCLPILLEQLKSPSLTVVSNACGTLWNLSARCPQDQRYLWELGAVGMLKNLVNSKHKMISVGSKAALKNLLSVDIPGFTPNIVEEFRDSDNVPTLPARKLKAFKAELDENIAETCDNIESPKSSPTHNATGSVGHQVIGKYYSTPYQFMPYRMYTSFSGNINPGIISRSSSRDSIGSTHSDSLIMYRLHNQKFPPRSHSHHAHLSNNASNVYWAQPVKTVEEAFMSGADAAKNISSPENPLPPHYEYSDIDENEAIDTRLSQSNNSYRNIENGNEVTTNVFDNGREAVNLHLPDLIEDTKKSPENERHTVQLVIEDILEECESLCESNIETTSSFIYSNGVSSSYTGNTADVSISSMQGDSSEMDRSDFRSKKELSQIEESSDSLMFKCCREPQIVEKNDEEKCEVLVIEDYDGEKLENMNKECDQYSSIQETSFSEDMSTASSDRCTNALLTVTDNADSFMNNINNNYPSRSTVTESTTEDTTIVDSGCNDLSNDVANLMYSIASDMSDSSCVSDIENVKPPSMMDELSMSMTSSTGLNDSYTSKQNYRWKDTRKHCRIPVAKKTYTSKNSNNTSNDMFLDNTNPPSLMDEVSGLSSSCGSLNSVGSDDVYDPPTDHIKKLNEEATAIVQQYTKEINQLTQSYNSTQSCDSEILEKIQPPKVFHETNCDTTYVVSPAFDVSDIDEFDELPRDSRDDNTLVPEHTSFGVMSLGSSDTLNILNSPCRDSEFNDPDNNPSFVEFVVQENAKLAAHVFNEMAANVHDSRSSPDDIYLENENFSLISSDDDSKATYTVSPRKPKIVKPVNRNVRREESISKKVAVNNLRKAQMSSSPSHTAPSSPLFVNKIAVKETRTSALRAARSKSAETSTDVPQKNPARNSYSEKRCLNNQTKGYSTKTFVIRKKTNSSPSVNVCDTNQITNRFQQTQNNLKTDAKETKTMKLNEKNNNLNLTPQSSIEAPMIAKKETQSKIASLWKRSKNKEANKSMPASDKSMNKSYSSNLTRSSTYEKLPNSAEEAMQISNRNNSKSMSLSKVRPAEPQISSQTKKSFGFFEKSKCVAKLSNSFLRK